MTPRAANQLDLWAHVLGLQAILGQYTTMHSTLSALPTVLGDLQLHTSIELRNQRWAEYHKEYL